MSEAVQLELVKGVISLVSPVLTALLLYLVGRYLTDRYNEQKKRAELALLQASQVAQKQRELQLEAAGRFYELYGEFFGLWKQWSAARANKVAAADLSSFRLELYRRACLAEGQMEGVLVRIVTEFRLSPAEVETLGKFRQAYQSIREAIREDRELGWNRSSDPEYLAFKRLATAVASLLTRHTTAELPTPGEAASRLVDVTDNRWERGWEQLVKSAD